MDSGFGKQILNQQPIRLHRRKVGTHVERDASQSHRGQQRMKCDPCLLFIEHVVGFRQTERAFEQPCQRLILRAMSHLVPLFIHRLRFRIDPRDDFIPTARCLRFAIGPRKFVSERRSVICRFSLKRRLTDLLAQTFQKEPKRIVIVFRLRGRYGFDAKDSIVVE